MQYSHRTSDKAKVPVPGGKMTTTNKAGARPMPWGTISLGVAASLVVAATVVVAATMRLTDGGCIGECIPRQDLAMQTNMALAAWGVLVVSAGTGAASLVLIYSTLKAAQRSALAAEDTVRETRRIGEAQTRSYLTVKSAEMTVAQGTIRVDYYFRNSGQTPARDIRTFVRTEVQRFEDDGWQPRYHSKWQYKARSDVPSQESRDGYIITEQLPVSLLSDLVEKNYRVIVQVRFVYKDVFDIEIDETVRYGVYLKRLFAGKYTLYRQIADLDMDEFD